MLSSCASGITTLLSGRKAPTSSHRFPTRRRRHCAGHQCCAMRREIPPDCSCRPPRQRRQARLKGRDDLEFSGWGVIFLGCLRSCPPKTSSEPVGRRRRVPRCGGHGSSRDLQLRSCADGRAKTRLRPFESIAPTVKRTSPKPSEGRATPARRFCRQGRRGHRKASVRQRSRRAVARQ